MKTVIIVQARMTSTRLPGKVLKEVLNKPLLEYQIERLRRVGCADEVVIATTTNDTDLPIIDLCSKLAVNYFRGSEKDVLSRYYEAAQEYGADTVVRITSDCPLIDPQVIDKVISFYKNNYRNYDYVCNNQYRTYPRGMDTEVFSFAVLEEAFREATATAEREHVTPFIYWNPQRYRVVNIENSEDQSKHRWTVDTMEDFILIKNIIEELYPVKPDFGMEDVLKLFNKYPHWMEINNFIEQKPVI